MGFNKRFINMQNLLINFKSGGMDGIKRYLLKADAFIVNTSDNSVIVLDKLNDGDIFGAQLILEYELHRQDLS